MALIDSLRNLDGFVIDLDGVIYLRRTLIPGATDFISELESAGKKYVFLTNNSSRTREEYVRILRGFQIKSSKEQIVTSAYATGQYLLERSPRSRIYIVGEGGLRSELSRTGFEIVEEPPADFVVVGIDLHFTYEKLKLASRSIRSGARFIATNRDATYPTEQGLCPGAGSIVSAVKTASGKNPTTIGKPNRWIFNICTNILGIDPVRTAVIGDRFETDIIGGSKVGMKTVLVLSGVTDYRDIRRMKLRPDIIAPSVGHLIA